MQLNLREDLVEKFIKCLERDLAETRIANLDLTERIADISEKLEGRAREKSVFDSRNVELTKINEES